MIITKDKILITYYDYDVYPEDDRTGSLLTIFDLENRSIGSINSKNHPKEKLFDLYSELEKISQERDLDMKPIKPIFRKYGL